MHTLHLQSRVAGLCLVEPMAWSATRKLRCRLTGVLRALRGLAQHRMLKLLDRALALHSIANGDLHEQLIVNVIVAEGKHLIAATALWVLSSKESAGRARGARERQSRDTWPTSKRS